MKQMQGLEERLLHLVILLSLEMSTGNWRMESLLKLLRVSHYPIQWVTTGKGVLSGDEKVSFEAEVGNQQTGYTHVTFVYSNPDKGNNSCDVLVSKNPSFVKAISDIPCTTEH